MFQPHAYATPTSQNSTSRISGVGFFTLIQGISTATYLTLPRLPRRPIRPEPFQYSLIGDLDGTWTRDLMRDRHAFYSSELRDQILEESHSPNGKLYRLILFK